MIPLKFTYITKIHHRNNHARLEPITNLPEPTIRTGFAFLYYNVLYLITILHTISLIFLFSMFPSQLSVVLLQCAISHTSSLFTPLSKIAFISYM